MRHRYARFPYVQRAVIALCASLALVADIAHGQGNITLARSAFCGTLMLLLVAFALMRCCLLVDADGVFIGTPLRRHRLLWRDMAALGYVQCNSRRVYLYGMARGDGSFARLMHDAPFCSARHFVAPATPALRAALVSLCPFPPESGFGHADPLPRSHRRLLSRLYLPALLLLPGGLLALFTAWRLALSAASDVYPTGTLVLLCALSLICCAAGLYLLSCAHNTLAANPVLGPEGVRVGFAGRSLTLRWTDARDLCRLKGPGSSTLYVLSCTMPPAGSGIAQPPMRCLSLYDTRNVLFAVHSFCLRPMREVRIPSRLDHLIHRGDDA